MNDEIYESVEARHYFSDAEKLQIADRLANLTQQIEDLENRKKAIASEFKAQVEAKMADASLQSLKFRNGYEMRNIECYVKFEPSTNTKRFYNRNTYEYVSSAEMTRADWQLPLIKEQEINKAEPAPINPVSAAMEAAETEPKEEQNEHTDQSN